MTGFARFVLFLLIVGPLAYLGASYYNGEDGWTNLKRALRVETWWPAASNPGVESAPEPTAPSQLGDRVAVLEQEIAELRELLRAKEVENRELRRQIELLKQTR